jgi:hypothetical protein
MENSVVNNEDALRPMPGSEAFIHNIDSAPAYWWINDLWVVLAQAKDTGGGNFERHEKRGYTGQHCQRNIDR